MVSSCLVGAVEFGGRIDATIIRGQATAEPCRATEPRQEPSRSSIRCPRRARRQGEDGRGTDYGPATGGRVLRRRSFRVLALLVLVLFGGGSAFAGSLLDRVYKTSDKAAAELRKHHKRRRRAPGADGPMRRSLVADAVAEVMLLSAVVRAACAVALR